MRVLKEKSYVIVFPILARDVSEMKKKRSPLKFKAAHRDRLHLRSTVSLLRERGELSAP
jgi:hypothetical protein